MEAKGPGIWLGSSPPPVFLWPIGWREQLVDRVCALVGVSLWPLPPGTLPGGLCTHRGPDPMVHEGRGASSTRRPLGGSRVSWVRPTCMHETQGGRPSCWLLGEAQSPRPGGRPLRGPGLLGLGGCPGHRPPRVLVLGRDCLLGRGLTVLPFWVQLAHVRPGALSGKGRKGSKGRGTQESGLRAWCPQRPSHPHALPGPTSALPPPPAAPEAVPLKTLWSRPAWSGDALRICPELLRFSGHRHSAELHGDVRTAPGSDF